MNINELREEILKITASDHNKLVKSTKINEAFSKFEEDSVTVITLNPGENTGNPDAPEGITINSKGELEGDLGEDKPTA